MRYQAPHDVRDQAKLAALIKALDDGKKLPPILVLGDKAFSGSHRLAAWEACGIEPSVSEITDEEYCAVLNELGLDPMDDVHDFNDFIEAAHKLGLALDAE